jgi:hypothetical protein
MRRLWECLAISGALEGMVSGSPSLRAEIFDACKPVTNSLSSMKASTGAFCEGQHTGSPAGAAGELV